jgi:triacylglycerol lipase
MRNSVRIAVLAGAVAAGAAVAPAAQATPEHDPVVFVHGIDAHGSDWDTMKSRFMADGYRQDELLAFDYDSSRSNADTAKQLGRFIDRARARTGSAKVDVVAHSMGALSSRHWMESLPGNAAVDDWVGLAAPNHGTDDAYRCSSAACQEMRPGSAFLDELNAGDETPGAVHYATLRSQCDRALRPSDTTALAGAQNLNAGCIAHPDFPADPNVYQQVRDVVR